MRHFTKTVSTIVGSCSTRTVLTVWVLTSLAAALAGPFGTYNSQPFMLRLGYWAFVIGVSVPVGAIIRVLWQQFLGDKKEWVEDLFVVVTLTVVFGPMLVLLNLGMILHTDHPAIDWRLSVVATFFVGAAIVGIGRVMRSSAEDSASGEMTRRRDRLFDRINAPEGVRLTKVSSDNHYIKIRTDDNAEHRILMRLRDAVTEIDVEDGIWAHRSHWVALKQVQSIEIVNGKEVLKMRHGCDVPIGPKYRSQLIERVALPA